VGSRIRLAGRVLGMELAVEEVVTERRPPHSKRWQTVGSPKLLVVGHYAMGFRLEPRGEQSELCVFIEYEVPRGPVTRWLGRLLGGVFAQWCVRRMVDDAVQHFASRPKRPAPSTYDPRRRFAMTRLDPWRFGAVVAITVVVSYTLCTLFWFAFNEPSIDSLNALFHGMDFRRIHTTAAFSLGDFGGVLAVFAVWGYTTGVIYAVVRNVLMVRSNT
jgi:hypothetical protein